MVQWSRNKNNSSLTMRSAMQALADSCFHFAFFGALDDDNDNDHDHDNDDDNDKDKKGEEGDGKNRILRTSKEHHDYEMEKLEMLKRIFLQSPSPNPGNININNSTKRGVFPLHRVTKILHCKQHETWDCGLLCIQMIVRWIQIQNVQGTSTDTGTDTDTDTDTDTTYTNFGDTLPLTPEEIQQKHKFIRALDTKSIWTIDLVMLFQNILSGHFDVLTDTDPRTREGTSTATSSTSTVNTNCSYLFCSKHMGVDSTYKGLHYYKTSFRKDARRVKRLFASAHHQHLPLATVAEANLSMDFVLPLISLPNVVAICLIDDHVVRRWGVEPELDCWDGTYVYDPPELMNFAGHYVIVSGVVRVSQVPPGSIIAGRSSDGDCDGADGDGADGDGEDTNADVNADVNVNEQDAMGGTEHENNARNMHDANPSMYTYTYTDDYCIVMKNPGSPNATEFITVDLFEQAWKAKGTDQDIIFIALHENDDGEDDDDGDGDEDDDDKNHAMNTLHRVA